MAVEPSGRFETMRTLAPPAGRGWEYLTGTGWDFPAELAQLPELLAEKLAAPSVEPGRYDLVVDPTNLWLTIHESIGHATELDRALGYEAAYAGTSFATLDQLGTLQYGAPVMHVTGDRTAPHGLATVGYDDEGVAAQSWDLISGGVLVGYQLDRRIARLRGLGRSNGCAFADSPGHMPIQRMANVSLQPAPGGPGTEELIAGVENGIYVVGDKSWSIDMQRYNFQFTGQRFYRIASGRLAGQLRDVAYQATTTDFWNSMAAVGGPQTYLLGGAFNCGKGQPGQVAPVSHGCPAVAVIRRPDPQRGAGGRRMSAAQRPQEAVERALAAAGGDDCVVIADEVSSANLRWAGNTLTTNGVSRSRSLTVIMLRPAARRDGGGRGVPLGRARREPGGRGGGPGPAGGGRRGARRRRPAAAGPGRRAGPAGTPDWDAPAETTEIGVFRRLRGGTRRAPSRWRRAGTAGSTASPSTA